MKDAVLDFRQKVGPAAANIGTHIDVAGVAVIGLHTRDPCADFVGLVLDRRNHRALYFFGGWCGHSLSRGGLCRPKQCPHIVAMVILLQQIMAMLYLTDPATRPSFLS